jgi:hypothetical protein
MTDRRLQKSRARLKFFNSLPGYYSSLRSVRSAAPIARKH